MYRVLLKASAAKELDELPLQIQKRIAVAIDELAFMGIHAKNTKKLQLPIGGYRMRVGEYRILFDREDEMLLIHHIAKRADAY